MKQIIRKKIPRKIKVGDTIKILAGKEKGKISTVIKFFKKNRVIAKDLNIKEVFVSKKVRDEKNNMVLKKIKIKKESGIDISNVALFDQTTNSVVKIGYSIIDGKKERINKNTGEKI